MLEQLWEQFKGAGYSGSISIRESGHIVIKSDSEKEYRNIHEAIYQLDPEYKFVKVIQKGFPPTKEMLCISLGMDPIQNRDLLENALMEGLGHQKIFKEANSGAIVQFGYEKIGSR